MIKINLASKKQQLNLANLGGLDFTKVKIKALLLVIFIMYVPDFTITPMWQQERDTKNQELQDLKRKLSRLRTEVNKAKDFEKQIQDLKIQEQALGKKLVAVKEAINIKKNPAALLLYVAKNTPSDLWIKELSIEKETMVIKGEALNYTSIGEFVSSLRSSVFIKEANIASTISTVRDSDKLRIEQFEVKFAIARFEQ